MLQLTGESYVPTVKYKSLHCTTAWVDYWMHNLVRIEKKKKIKKKRRNVQNK